MDEDGIVTRLARFNSCGTTKVEVKCNDIGMSAKRPRSIDHGAFGAWSAHDFPISMVACLASEPARSLGM